MTRACLVPPRFSSGAVLTAVLPCRAGLSSALFLTAAADLRAAPLRAERRGVGADAVCFDVAMRALHAVGDGISRRHGRSPAIGLTPAGWEGSPGSAELLRPGDTHS